MWHKPCYKYGISALVGTDKGTNKNCTAVPSEKPNHLIIHIQLHLNDSVQYTNTCTYIDMIVLSYKA